MERQLAGDGPTCQRCGSPRGIQPTWERDELTCVNCGASSYVPLSQIHPADEVVASAGFLDEMFQSVIEELERRTEKRTRREAGAPKRQRRATLTQGRAVCVPHERKKRTWTIPEFAWVVDPRPARWARAAADLSPKHRCHAPKLD